MKNREQVIDQIRQDPEQALADIETLGKELIVERMLSDSRDSLCKYFSEQAEIYWHRYHEIRKALVKARIQVRELKLAVSEAHHDHFSDSEPNETQD